MSTASMPWSATAKAGMELRMPERPDGMCSAWIRSGICLTTAAAPSSSSALKSLSICATARSDPHLDDEDRQTRASVYQWPQAAGRSLLYDRQEHLTIFWKIA